MNKEKLTNEKKQKKKQNIVGFVRPFEDIVQAARTIYEHL